MTNEEQRNIEVEIAESVYAAFSVVLGEFPEIERHRMARRIQPVETTGQPVGKIMMGVLMASTALYANLTGRNPEEITMEEAAGAFTALAEAFEEAKSQIGGDE